jgi:hypothetical protein
VNRLTTPFSSFLLLSCFYSEFYNNQLGLVAIQVAPAEENAKFMFEDVTMKNNVEQGVYATGTGITINNAAIKNNRYGLEIGPNLVNDITLAGDISVTNNEYGLRDEAELDVYGESQGTVHVTGNLKLNRNEVDGLVTYGSSGNLAIAVGDSYSGKSGKSGSSGSLTACDNGVSDITSAGTIFEGTDYTCDEDKTSGPNLPECMPCYPDC